jgi:hypothetical protein
MSIITIPGNGTAFTTAELILNFTRLSYLSTQHGDEPVPLPDQVYTLIDVYNHVFWNVPNYIENHGRRLIFNVNRIRKSVLALPGVTDAEWDQLVILISTSVVNESAITDWLDNSVDVNGLTLTVVTELIIQMTKIINTEVSLMNKWFSLSLVKFDETQLLIAIETENAALVETELANLNAVSHAITDYAVPMLEPLVIIRPEDSAVVVDRLINYSDNMYHPDTVLTSPWLPSSATVLV